MSNTITRPKTILVTGATGKQGGAVVEALANNEEFQILAVTRNASGAAAKGLLERFPNIKIVEGNMDDAPKLFEAAKDAGNKNIWGVFSVQVSEGKGVTFDSEVRQGKAMIDEAIKNKVETFVYSSVERGGDEKSWTNQTPVDHFKSKYFIEQHLRDNADKSMKWTILRPVALMENMKPGFETTVFFTALKNALGQTPMQWVATRDVGRYAEKAFVKPERWDRKAVGLAGEEMTFSQLSDQLKSSTGSPAGTTYGILASALRWAIPEIARMLDWFASDGYRADIGKLRESDSELLTFKKWLEKDSQFTAKA
ncbi:NAD(P)-binding Rossmann-fold containing protein [Glarea lozoyensis ATCC 20868]|uniref:NAD(P)-binding Rossmann-fold containing protein n=1 Tax=Glarea lozoyensis (strain ATCC 20868 / MF5171) TaxID=1116229 RepID=S3EFZ5_GLAL2|nr:NAD(P)-binding Rossmann-fold containing protein [Glarea lozoyensis ATCC 20868]EPE37108.1 NAD(P)-binding Rossmann-fold containing protein [Glarea lozoyensis ATCC 20868]